ncbi:hypothetical protein LTR10_021162 [Elasticomyces elasticus]|uniref:Retrovirus-related Pol polyprotein from transposon TNT 1-94-like beta-barrel domain-containing protein n=1 Tax=Exophiala sideris TaxID=1016849 RepID=A0ABR0JNY8_9EURO|nr:hypothetical protein LTR10_021162 [Elasticomyces elasticus]KAK5038207.1 hypothetical protein LTS07_001676 [Exophiala sideris]KAK5044191.1 hypothetical protein LTR13_000547 [Exophiala sideris]KAK5067691.1 hypothetical protein LTR69_001680 [Exophiala sideris]KAK5184068.1 hypothetical protein LTR44_003574 [Eurotiomycetes sp. CCFEE 6388]
MPFNFDPRGDLPPPIIQPSSYYSDRRGTVHGAQIKKPKKKQCYDWIFSTASNVHVATDRAAFKTYFAFKSYALTVADQSQVSVRGIGTVEKKIRRAAGSKESHTILLEDVLHIPDWLCNIVSDILFMPSTSYEHTWTEFGVNFFNRKGRTIKPWGYTENFCGLDRLVLAHNKQGRSPMLEDPDREVFSVNLTWPQSQKDKWNDFLAQAMKFEAERMEERSKNQKQEDTIGRKRAVKSTSIEPPRWKMSSDMTAEDKHPRRGSVGKSMPDLLPRGSSLRFGSSKV